MMAVVKKTVVKKPVAKKSGKVRLDQLLVERGLAASREKAQALVLAGQVMVAFALRPSISISRT